jgi:hypothetical protein
VGSSATSFGQLSCNGEKEGEKGGSFEKQVMSLQNANCPIAKQY